jgi:hypothetical protein
MKEIEKYKKYMFHPRVLELRVMNIYNIFAREYSVEGADYFFRAMCPRWNIDYQKISTIMQNATNAKKVGRQRYRQEVVFMGIIWGESYRYIALRYLNVTAALILARENGHKIEDFVTTEWLSQLSMNTQICGIEAYRLEAIRFLEAYDRFRSVVANVPIPKTEVYL